MLNNILRSLKQHRVHRLKSLITEHLPSYLWVYSRGWGWCIPPLCGAWFWSYSLRSAFLEGWCREPRDTGVPGHTSPCTRRRTQERGDSQAKLCFLFFFKGLLVYVRTPDELKPLLTHHGVFMLLGYLGCSWLEMQSLRFGLLSQHSFNTHFVQSPKPSSKKERRN